MTLHSDIKRLCEARNAASPNRWSNVEGAHPDDVFFVMVANVFLEHGEQLLRCLDALEPFAKVAELSSHPKLDPESVRIWQRTSTIEGDEYFITLADCQRARDALRNTGEKA